MTRPPLPPFTAEAAARKARNTRDPAKVALAYTLDSAWRNCAEFVVAGRPSRHFSRANGSVSLTIG
jgi:nuclear transport factor 2 (NTF2) superfamily protein